MSDRQPEMMASANLSPVSPKPIHLASPIVVPTLQDQADTLYRMAPSPMIPLTSHTSAAPEPVPDSAAPTPEIKTEEQARDHREGGWLPGPDTVSNDWIQDPEGAEEKGQFQPLETVVDAGHRDAPMGYTTSGSTETADELTNRSATGLHPVNAPSDAAVKPDPAEKEAQDRVKIETTQGVAISTVSAALHYQQQHPEATEKHTEQHDVSTNTANSGEIDIQALVDNITARAEAEEAQRVSTSSTGLLATSPPSSLPPRPPVSQSSTPAYMRPEDMGKFPPGLSGPATQPRLPTVHAPLVSSYPYAAPGSLPDVQAGPSAVNAGSKHAMPPTPHQLNSAQPSLAGKPQQQRQNLEQKFQSFLVEERRYVTEGRWDKFPEGSRLFVGNLSSERANKKEVFEIFHKYGRLAQISLKQAYGFVQYHTVTEGRAAMEACQGMDIKGRKVHLEFSRLQKKNENEGEKQRGSKGGRGASHNDRNTDRHTDHYDGRRRDEQRPRSRSPGLGRGNHYRHQSTNSYNSQIEYGGRDLPRHDTFAHPRTGRSRSPLAARPDTSQGGYRQRSRSPFHRSMPTSEADLDIPRRYGYDVPDVQLLLLQEVDTDFVTWLERAFMERGLRTNVMHLSPRLPRELVIRRQVVEGVHGVSELDFRAQQTGRISLQVFDRSAGAQNARFDLYQDIDPKIAAELVARAKSNPQPQFQAQSSAPPPASAVYGSNGQYGVAPYQPYPTAALAPYQYAQTAAGPGPQGLGQVDNTTLQKVLAAMQTPQGSVTRYPVATAHGAAHGAAHAHVNGPPHGPAQGAMPPHLQQSTSYAPMSANSPTVPGDANLQTILAQLASRR